MRKNLIVATLVSTALVSCKTRIMDYTIISTKNLDMSRIGEMKRSTGEENRIVGVDRAHIVLIFPVTKKASMEEAVDKALESIPGAVALVDGVVYRRDFRFPFVYGLHAIIVEGTPVIDESLIGYQPIESTGYSMVQINEEDSIFQTKSITAKDYQELFEKN